ncbi:MAG: hypothetical protein HQL32_06215, partial [Planctomycetes bacterium]|nr:hypothetical protein [Planctomycetota bacterium]
WENLNRRFPTDDIKPRYALHLLYTQRRSLAENIYINLEPSELPSYVALKKVFVPKEYQGELSSSEKIALSDFFERQVKWHEALHWLP